MAQQSFNSRTMNRFLTGEILVLLLFAKFFEEHRAIECSI